MMSETEIRKLVTETITMIGAAEANLRQARTRLEGLAGHDASGPVMDAKTAARVDNLGQVAHRHLAFLEAHDGQMTRADSLAIRREMYGKNVRHTANQFGRSASGALFYRDRPYGSPVRNDDQIRLTAEGLRIAGLWRQLHPDAA
jgi:hypothetical protein